LSKLKGRYLEVVDWLPATSNMKFGKKLQLLLESSLPDWKDAFVSYKKLKKDMKSNETYDLSFGSKAPMTFLTAAIQSVDENPAIEDELSDGDEEGEAEVGQKRKSGDGTHFEEQKKRKCDSPIEVSEEPSDRVAEEQSNLAVKESSPYGQKASLSAGQEQGGCISRHRTEGDENFLGLIKSEVIKCNNFFLGKEEVFLIRLSILEEKTKDVKEKRSQRDSGLCDHSSYETLVHLQKQAVTLHGEMVLLLQYSALNYVGLMKILKKYDKHSNSNLRQSVLGAILQQPFCSITNLKGMIARCMACVESLRSDLPAPGDVVQPMWACLARDVATFDILQSEPIPRQIRAALLTMQTIQ
jgi:hypothetical protein